MFLVIKAPKPKICCLGVLPSDMIQCAQCLCDNPV